MYTQAQVNAMLANAPYGDPLAWAAHVGAHESSVPSQHLTAADFWTKALASGQLNTTQTATANNEKTKHLNAANK